MEQRVAIFLIEGGKALDLVREHIAAVRRVRAANAQVIRDLGLPTETLARISRFDGRLMAVRFPAGKVPAGWTKPDSKHDCSNPKKGTEWAARLGALPGWPAPEEVISEAFQVPLSLEYSKKGKNASRGYRSIGPMLTACGWLYMSGDGPFAMWVPDVPAEVQQLQQEGFTVGEPGRSFRLEFEGCRRILQEEWDLMVARRKLEEAQGVAA